MNLRNVSSRTVCGVLLVVGILVVLMGFSTWAGIKLHDVTGDLATGKAQILSLQNEVESLQGEKVDLEQSVRIYQMLTRATISITRSSFVAQEEIEEVRNFFYDASLGNVQMYLDVSYTGFPELRLKGKGGGKVTFRDGSATCPRCSSWGTVGSPFRP